MREGERVENVLGRRGTVRGRTSDGTFVVVEMDPPTVSHTGLEAYLPGELRPLPGSLSPQERA